MPETINILHPEIKKCPNTITPKHSESEYCLCQTCASRAKCKMRECSLRGNILSKTYGLMDFTCHKPKFKCTLYKCQKPCSPEELKRVQQRLALTPNDPHYFCI